MAGSFWQAAAGMDVDDWMAEDDGELSMDARGELGEALDEALKPPSALRDSFTTLPDEVFAAGHTGEAETVRAFLVDPRGDVNARDRHMRGTLLMAAAAAQQLRLVETLLRAGASVHVTDAFGCTALSSASCPLDHQPIRFELARGAAPTASRQAVVQRLMAAEADPNVQDQLGLSALMVAAISGEAECVRCLMQGGARSDLLEDNGYSARHRLQP